MQAGEIKQLMHNLAIAALNEGVAKRYFGAEQGQDFAVPENNNMVEYAFCAHGVVCTALLTRANESELAFQIYVQMSYLNVAPRSAILFTFWARRKDRIEIGSTTIQATSAFTLEVARQICNGDITPQGYSILWADE